MCMTSSEEAPAAKGAVTPDIFTLLSVAPGQGAQVGGGLGGAQQLVPDRQNPRGLSPDAEVNEGLVSRGEAEVEAKALKVQLGYAHRAEIRAGCHQAGGSAEVELVIPLQRGR